jgi:hypothetical protein
MFMVMTFFGMKCSMLNFLSTDSNYNPFMVDNHLEVLNVNTTSAHVFRHLQNCSIVMNFVIDFKFVPHLAANAAHKGTWFLFWWFWGFLLSSSKHYNCRFICDIEWYTFRYFL